MPHATNYKTTTAPPNRADGVRALLSGIGWPRALPAQCAQCSGTSNCTRCVWRYENGRCECKCMRASSGATCGHASSKCAKSRLPSSKATRPLRVSCGGGGPGEFHTPPQRRRTHTNVKQNKHTHRHAAAQRWASRLSSCINTTIGKSHQRDIYIVTYILILTFTNI